MQKYTSLHVPVQGMAPADMRESMKGGLEESHTQLLQEQ
jgi:hypothetical protein